MKWILLLPIVLAMIFLTGCSELIHVESKEGSESTTCIFDWECVKVTADCCGCAYGGQATAINKEFKEEHQKNLNEGCKSRLCPAVISKDWTCSSLARPKCVNKVCKLVKIP